MSCAGSECGGSREEVGTAAGPMALREEEEGLSHIVGAWCAPETLGGDPREEEGVAAGPKVPGRRKGPSHIVGAKGPRMGCGGS